MSCNTCQVKFSFFTRNIGCPSCGYSCCKKCLKYKCDNLNVGSKKICGRCYNKLNKMKKSSSTDVDMDDALTTNTSKEPLAPIDIAMKLDSLENPVKPPIVIYKHTSHWDKLKMGLEPVDQQIVDRLRKLKDEEWNTPLPTVDEINQRLALLKDQNPETSGNNIIDIHRVDTRTDQEKVDDLMQEYLAQMELPSTSDFSKDIQERLDLLRDDDDKTRLKEKIDTYKKLYDTIDDDNIELINKTLAIKIETSNIEEDENEMNDEDEDENENECVMCSRNANESDLYRCMGCTGDLYCLSCFESSHDESEMIDKHKAVRFVKEDKRDSSSVEMSYENY